MILGEPLSNGGCLMACRRAPTAAADKAGVVLTCDAINGQFDTIRRRHCKTAVITAGIALRFIA